MTLLLTVAHRQIMYDRAQASYPEECCGILLGTIEGALKTVVEVIPTTNVWEPYDPIDRFTRTKTTRYTIPPQDLLLAQKRGRALDLEIIGFFHSHPDHPAIPSDCDRDLAWEVYSYPIVAMADGKISDFQSWVLNGNSLFVREDIQLLD